MKTNNDLLKKYSTGQVYVSPAAVEYGDSRLRSHYYCRGELNDVLIDYMEHVSNPATKRCNTLPVFTEDGVLRVGEIEITDEEMKWLNIEYLLRESIKTGKRTKRIRFVVMED